MSWYNNQNQGFIDATQELNIGVSQATSNYLEEINEVFIPKILDTQNATTDTLIVNNTANSRIFIKNSNTTPKIRIEGGKLYLYYDYNFTNAPTITAGWIDVDNYITAIKQQVIILDGLVVGLEAIVLAPVTGLKPRVEVIEPILATTTAEVIELRGKVDYLSLENDLDWESDVLSTHLNENFDSYMQLFREDLSGASDKFLEVIRVADRAGLGRAGKEASKLFRSTAELAYAYFSFVLFGLGGIALILQGAGEYYDRYIANKLDKDEARQILMYEKIKDSSSANLPKHIHKDGLQILTASNNGFSTFSIYKITLSNQAIIRIKTNGSLQPATIESVEDVGNIFWNVNDIINVPKTSLGGSSGNLQIQVISLISEVEVIAIILNKMDNIRNGINNRRRLREGIINTNELGDGLKTEYNSSITNAETGETLQVPTIKLNLNIGQR